jgi:CRP-like cAMP-binding protein
MKFEQLGHAIRQMITISESEMNELTSKCSIKKFEPKEFLSEQNEVSVEIFFINKGLIRSLIIDPD